jgi:hypothetical protein
LFHSDRRERLSLNLPTHSETEFGKILILLEKKLVLQYKYSRGSVLIC